MSLITIAERVISDRVGVSSWFADTFGAILHSGGAEETDLPQVEGTLHQIDRDKYQGGRAFRTLECLPETGTHGRVFRVVAMLMLRASAAMIRVKCDQRIQEARTQ